MTTTESIVTSLDWSKKLKEAGWPQDDSHFIWANLHWDGFKLGTGARGPEDFAAPTAEEILRRLPKAIESSMDDEFELTVQPSSEGWGVGYLCTYESVWMNNWVCEYNTLANAAAAMYCYLAEKKLLPKSQ